MLLRKIADADSSMSIQMYSSLIDVRRDSTSLIDNARLKTRSHNVHIFMLRKKSKKHEAINKHTQANHKYSCRQQSVIANRVNALAENEIQIIN